MPAYSVLISAWLVGALGGLHCLAMCSGFVAAIAARDGAAGDGTVPLLPARAIVHQQLVYRAGRITTYMLLGTARSARQRYRVPISYRFNGQCTSAPDRQGISEHSSADNVGRTRECGLVWKNAR